MKSVLELPLEESDRPYSQKELKFLRDRFYFKSRLGTTIIKHDDCKHFYIAKKGGKKETEFLKSGDVGNCSVCWKIRRTPRKLRQQAESLVQKYCELFQDAVNTNNFTDENMLLLFNYLSVEKYFYTWLYQEFNGNNI